MKRNNELGLKLETQQIKTEEGHVSYRNVVAQVVEGGPADRDIGGNRIKPGDRIIQVNGERVHGDPCKRVLQKIWCSKQLVKLHIVRCNGAIGSNPDMRSTAASTSPVGSAGNLLHDAGNSGTRPPSAIRGQRVPLVPHNDSRRGSKNDEFYSSTANNRKLNLATRGWDSRRSSGVNDGEVGEMRSQRQGWCQPSSDQRAGNNRKHRNE